MKMAFIHLLSVVGFMAVSFTAQVLSHLVITQKHLSSIDDERPMPVISLGLA